MTDVEMKDASATDKKQEQEATGDKASEEPSDNFYGKTPQHLI
jgi:hypothetical protein